MNEQTYTTVIPSFATPSQVKAFERINATIDGLDNGYLLEFPTDLEPCSKIFFSLKSTKSHEDLMMGTVGKRGGLVLQHFNYKYEKDVTTGCLAWSWLDIQLGVRSTW